MIPMMHANGQFRIPTKALWRLAARSDASPTKLADVDMRAETEKQTKWSQNIRFVQQIWVITDHRSECNAYLFFFPFGKETSHTFCIRSHQLQ